MTIRLSLDEKLEGFAKSTMNLFGSNGHIHMTGKIKQIKKPQFYSSDYNCDNYFKDW